MENICNSILHNTLQLPHGVPKHWQLQGKNKGNIKNSSSLEICEGRMKQNLCFLFRCHWSVFLRVKVLVNRLRAISWNNTDQVQWRHMVSSGRGRSTSVDTIRHGWPKMRFGDFRWSIWLTDSDLIWEITLWNHNSHSYVGTNTLGVWCHLIRSFHNFPYLHK